MDTQFELHGIFQSSYSNKPAYFVLYYNGERLFTIDDKYYFHCLSLFPDDEVIFLRQIASFEGFVSFLAGGII